jgi:hypothetical protein
LESVKNDLLVGWPRADSHQAMFGSFPSGRSEQIFENSLTTQILKRFALARHKAGILIESFAQAKHHIHK